MRTISRSSQFKKDYKRASRGKYQDILECDLSTVLTALANDQPLTDQYHDHALIGDWLRYRECHIKPDLLLIYKKLGSDQLQLARLGSHSQLFK